jgi:hypothetical protein
MAFSFYVPQPLPGCKTEDSNLIRKPTKPITPMPRKHIFIDSQSSLLPGFTASFRVLAH